jgi:hypothetical protein
MPSLLHRLARRAAQSPLDASAAALAVLACAWTVARPLAAAKYPPLVDLPMHAAHTSALRHWWDPAFHLREQFELHALEVPYVSTYALGALLSLVLPMHAAVNAATGVALLLLPAGLAVLARGLGKSPLVGVAGLALVWTNLTHWGFVNFVGALGLFAMAAGFALLVVERPTRSRQAGLAVSLGALFFTHVFRLPFALGAVALAAVAARFSGKSARPLLLPTLPSVGLFVLWTRIRPQHLGAGAAPLSLSWERLGEASSLFFTSYTLPEEGVLARSLAVSFGVAATALALLAAPRAFAALRALRGPHESADDQALARFAVARWLVPVGCVAACLLSFLTLPMQIGVWWYVYPREIVAAAAMALGCLPNLPTQPIAKLVAVVALVVAPLRMAHFVGEQFASFDKAAADFDRALAHLPPAPKLLYLVFEHGGSTRSVSPFLHLPAWAQATRGGWLSFHFAVFGATPLRYREPTEPGAVVPPPVPERWEWRPELFRAREHGAFFDWFLVRRTASPERLFRTDRQIELVAHEGSWWVFRRRAEETP